MSITDQKLRISPIRSVQEFIGGNNWIKPTFNPNEFGELQKQVVSNLIYYQSNYGAILIPILLILAFFYPAAVIFSLIVLAGLLTGFVFGTRDKTAVPILHDRPILILILLLVIAYFIINMFSTICVFLVGIVLPSALIVIHATVRKQTLQNKATSVVENLSLQTSPMGLLLGWLGAKSPEGVLSKSQ